MAYVAALFDPHSNVIAPLNERCWLLWLCVSSSGHICVAQRSLSVRITSHWIGTVKGLGRYDGEVVACPATVPVVLSASVMN